MYIINLCLQIDWWFYQVLSDIWKVMLEYECARCLKLLSYRDFRALLYGYRCYEFLSRYLRTFAIDSERLFLVGGIGIYLIK